MNNRFDEDKTDSKFTILDSQKQILELGDEVVYVSGYNHYLKKGIVTKINPKSVRIQFGLKDYHWETRVGGQIFIYKKHENEI